MPALLRLVYIAAYYMGIVHLFYWFNRNEVVVLTYHNVLPDALFDSSLHLGVSHSESVFRQQATMIRRRFRASGWPAAAGHCVVTFDDGYKNQWLVAGPILHEHRLRAIYFVVSETLVSGKCMVVDSVLKWLSYCPAGSYMICGRTVSISGGRRGEAWSQVYEGLLANPKYWDAIEAELDGQYKFAHLSIIGELDELRFTPFDEADLTSIIEAGHQIGCHSWRHRPLASLSPDQLAEDFRFCREAIGSYLNSNLYSYPFGSSTSEVSVQVMKQCAKAGFEWAFLNRDTPLPGLAGDPRYCVARLSLPNIADRYVIEAKLSGLERALKPILRL